MGKIIYLVSCEERNRSTDPSNYVVKAFYDEGKAKKCMNKVGKKLAKEYGITDFSKVDEQEWEVSTSERCVSLWDAVGYSEGFSVWVEKVAIE